MVGIYEWYIDVFFVVNFLMDTAGLLAAGIVCNQKIRFARLLEVSAGATLCSILMLLCLPAYFFYLLAIHIVVNPLMVAIGFRPQGWWDFLRLLLTAYLVLFVAGGVQQSMRLYGLDSAEQVLFSGFLAIGTFLVWQIRRRVTRQTCLVELEFRGEQILLTAFCDSGNLLRDPETGNAVSIVNRGILPENWILLEKIPAEESFHPKDTPDKKEKCRTDGVPPPIPRRIPYRTIGVGQGEMEVLTLDKMKIYRRGSVREVEKPAIGLFDGILMEHPKAELLLNSAYFSG